VAVARGDWEPAIVCCIILIPTFLLDSSLIFKKSCIKMCAMNILNWSSPNIIASSLRISEIERA
jgi:hypothetical protein